MAGKVPLTAELVDVGDKVNASLSWLDGLVRLLASVA